MNKPLAIALRRSMKKAMIQAGLETISGINSLGMMSELSGIGAIFTMHRVEPTPDPLFNPSAHLSVTPDFLEKTILALKAKNYRAHSLNNLKTYLKDPNPRQPAMFFTLDDGYKNNLEYALPVFKKHNVPFTVFACSGFVERSHTMWWETTAELLMKVDELNYDIGKGERRFEVKSAAQKYAAFEQISQDMTMLEHSAAVERLDQLASEHGINAQNITNALILTDEELRNLSKEPLADIGAHTISHANLALVNDQKLGFEMAFSKDHIETITGMPAPHFAFPYGKLENAGKREFEKARNSGFDLSVTTEPNVLDQTACQNLFALKRISLNGYYQRSRYVKALASGIPFKLMKAG
ncbi:polysaccharide deacetylase family protein [Lentilitoribacter sp. EG35]|uniref:polysaccharide deacetylase family protein n=1 Tax=Lentilitoribacter sp. EG35 TaxID=3234192 RepID=UPI00345FBCED